MANYANQNTIEINNEIIGEVAHKSNDNTSQFLRAIDWEYIGMAQQVLTGNELDVLLYILKWAGKGFYEFSPAGIEVDTQMSDSTAQRAFKRLLEIGFIEAKGNSIHKYKVNLRPKGIEELAKQKRAENLLKREEKNNRRKERESKVASI